MTTRRHVHLGEVGSTNAHARELAAAGAPDRTVVSADRQTAGRGRQGRAWSSPPGAVALSMIVRAPRTPALLPLAAAVATAAACGPEALIKWPNDIWLGPGHKVAGILVEAYPAEEVFVIGIGVNAAVAAGELAAGWATLGLDTPELPALRARLIDELDAVLDAEPSAILASWRARDGLRGTVIAWDGGEGTAAGIDEQGRLLVAGRDGGLARLVAGEVHLRR